MNRLWIVPPHRDPTLAPAEVSGWEVLDLQTAFCQRVLSPAALGLAAAAARDALLPGQSPRPVLELEAARAVLARAPAGGLAGLRAQGVALAALTRAGPIQLTLDDTLLAHGTSERIADLLAHTATPDSPWEPELERARQAVEQAGEVRLLVDCSKRLAFAFALVRRLSPQSRRKVQLGGGFAYRHRAALGTVSGFQSLEVVEEAPGFLVSLGGTRVRWRWEDVAVPPAPWCGYLPLAELPRAPASCQVAVVPFAAMEADRVLSLEGEWHPLAGLQRSRPGPTVVGEWHFGAPGVDAGLAERTASLLAQPGWCDWVCGLRRFEWGRHRPAQPTFAGAPLELGAVEPERELARRIPVRTPPAMAEEPLLALVQRTLTALSAGPTPPIPGRVAAALVAPPVAGEGSPERVGIAADAAFVELPVAMDGRAQRTLVAVSLRTGAMLALDTRLAPFLAALERPLPTAEALQGLAPAQREKLLTVLRERSFLEAPRG